MSTTLIEISGALQDKVKRGEAVVIGLIFYSPSKDKLHINLCGDSELAIAMLNKYGIPCSPVSVNSDGNGS